MKTLTAFLVVFILSQPIALHALWAYQDAPQSHRSSSVLAIEEWQDLYELNQVAIQADNGIEITSDNIAQLGQKTTFIRHDQFTDKLRPNQYYIGQFGLQNKLLDGEHYTEWVLEFSSSITEIDLYAQRSDGSYKKYKSGEYVSYRLKSFSPTLDKNLFKIILPNDQAVQFYFRAQSEKDNVPPNFNIALRHTDSFSTYLKDEKIYHYFLFGFFAMMILYSLTGAVIKQDKSFIYYTIYIMVLGTHAANSAGQFEDWFGYFLFPENPKYAYMFNTWIFVGFMAYIGFIRHFLNLQQLMPKWDRFYNYMFWLCIPTIVIHIIVAITSNYSSGVGDKVLAAYSSLFLISSVIFSFQLYKTKDKKGFFIVAGMLFILIDLGLNVLSVFDLVNYPLIRLKIGFVIEILIFSLGLAYREKEIVKAKEQANFELEKTKFLQEQEQEELGKLKKLNDLKSQLYTNITHEFRTPLTVIMGMSDNISGHEKERTLIQRNSENLLHLINQLLELSKAESATLVVSKTTGDIISFLQFLTESFYSMATDKGVRLTFYTEVSALETTYDESKIQHIFYNLLSNAIKFTEEDGKVIFHVKQVIENAEAFLKIKIQDTGIGIPEDQLPRIFDRFYQVDNSNTRKEDGTGIGLALVKELIQLMDGRIEVTSIEGEGTEFIVWMPIAIASIDANIPVAPKELNDFAGSEKSKLISPHKSMDIAVNGDLPILLIIEDNRDVAQYIQSILENSYSIHIAKNGQLGIDKAVAIIPDIIISDVMMPIKDGYEVCETLKNDKRTNHIPIILLTAKAAQEDKVEGLQSGADAFLTKPFHRDELLIRIENLTELRKALQERYTEHVSTNPDVEFEEIPFILQLKTIVIEQLSNADFSVADLGKAVFMSDTQVYRKMKALTNQTPTTFIRSIRLEKGEQLLRDSDLTIAEIAFEVGFNNPSYFSRTFQKVHGISPSEYRMQNGKGVIN